MLPGLPTPQSSTFLQALNDVQTINNLRSTGALQNSQANLANMQAQGQNITNQYLPQYQQIGLQQAQGKVFTDPLMQKGYESNIANQTGAVSQNYLNQFGLGQSQQGNSGPSSSQAPGTVGGIPTGTGSTFLNTMTPMQNWAITGNPYGQRYNIAVKGATSQAEAAGSANVSQYVDANAAANEDAANANKMKMLLSQYNTAYGNSKNVGPVLGQIPAYHGPEQQADAISNQITALQGKLLGGSRMTNKDITLAQDMKGLGRTAVPDTVKNLTGIYNATADRYLEEPDFLAAASQKGVDPQIAKSLWNDYYTQRPIYDSKNQKVNTQFQKTFSDYLSPEAVDAKKSGQNYVPVPVLPSKESTLDWFGNLSAADRQQVRKQLSGKP